MGIAAQPPLWGDKTLKNFDFFANAKVKAIKFGATTGGRIPIISKHILRTGFCPNISLKGF